MTSDPDGLACPVPTRLECLFDFGGVSVGGSAAVDVVLVATGSIAVHLHRLELVEGGDPAFRLDVPADGGLPDEIAAHDVATLSVSARPTMVGVVGATLAIEHDACNFESHVGTIELWAEGASP